MKHTGTEHPALFDKAGASDGTYSAEASASVDAPIGSGFPALFSDDEFDELHQQRIQAERSEHDRMDNAGIRLKPTPTDGLPESTIEQRFKHVAKQLVAMWPSEACAMFIKNLVISDRGTRQGFPQDVVDDLMMLYQINEMHCKTIGAKLKPGAAANLPSSHIRPPVQHVDWASVRKR